MAYKIAMTGNARARVVRLLAGWAAGLAAAFAVLAWLSEPAAAQQSAAPGVRLLRSDADGILIELSVPAYSLTTRTEGGETYNELSAAGMPVWSAHPAYPRLPAQGLMLGVPQDADVSVHVVAEDVSDVPLAHRLLPSPSYANDGLPGAGVGPDPTARYVPDAGAYARAGWAPTETVTLNSVGYMRSQRMAQINLYPFRYDASLGRLRWAKIIRVEVRFAYPAAASQAHGVFHDEGVFESVLRAQLLNYESARAWRQPVARPTTTAETGGAPRAAALAGGLFRVSVREEGIYRLTYADLITAGVPSDADPRTFKIIKNGSEVPIYVNGEANGVFDSADYVEFFAQSVDTRYTDVNVYWFTYGGANGQRMSVRSGAPAGGATPAAYTATVHVEENHLYDGTKPSGNGDHWFWGVVYTYVVPVNASFYMSTPVSYTFALTGLAAAMPTTTLRLQLYGLLGAANALVPHHVQYYVNGHLAGDDAWTGNVVHTWTGDIPSAYLVSGSNVLSLYMPNDTGNMGPFGPWDAVAMNWFEVDYPRLYQANLDYLEFSADAGPNAISVTAFSTSNVVLYDVTIPTQTMRLTGTVLSGSGSYALSFGDAPTVTARYVAAAVDKTPLSIVRDDSVSDLKNAANGADYIVITYDGFYTATAPLETLRSAQGLRVVRARTSDVYDEFSDGVFDAGAIRSFLTYAYSNWQPPAPQYVLLVGDGNLNYRNYFPNNVGAVLTNFIPPYLDAVDQLVNEVAVDNRYVNVSGNDIVPDMAIGRLPARSVTETMAVVNKILAYEQNPPSGAWRSTIDFFTDNYLSASGQPDPGGNFHATADGIISDHIPATYTTTRVYYNEYPLLTGTQYYSTPEAARNAITIAINSGALFANYVGHANIPLWASPILMSNSDVAPNVFASVANGARQPIVLELGCLTGAFQYPSNTALAKTFLMADGYGAIADWASSGASVNSGHDLLAGFFYDGVFQNDMRRVGLAINYSKAGVVATGAYQDIVDEFTLFGDPATVVNVLPVADLGISHVAAVSSTLAAGTPLTFTLRVSNSGVLTATGVVISDVLPAGVVSATYVASGAVVTPTGATPYVWQVADLAPGAIVTISVYARTDGYFFSQGVYAFTVSAQVSSATLEVNLANNVSVATVAPPVDLVITQRAPAIGFIDAGAQIVYTLQYTNTGGTVASGVVITDVVPAGLLTPTYTYSGASLSEAGGSPFVWSVSDLVPGSGGTIMVTASVDTAYWLSATTPLTNSAVIMGGVSEVTLANNVTSAVTLMTIPLKTYLPLVYR